MNATVDIVCYISKILSNGEHPLMLRICKDGKKKNKTKPVNVNRQISPSFLYRYSRTITLRKTKLFDLSNLWFDLQKSLSYQPPTFVIK